MAIRKCAGPTVFQLLVAAIATFGGVWTNLGAAQAQESFKGQTVTLLLGSPPGGGYDNYARPFVRHLGKHIPGNPTVIVQNMPGAGGIRAANYLYNVAPKDGTFIGMLSAATLFQPLFGSNETRFDTPKFSWIGNIDEIVGTCDVWQTAGVSHFDELQAKSVTFGAAGAGSASYQLPSALKNLLGAKIELVTGYPGATEVNLAMHRGEVGGTCGISLAALKSVYQGDYNAGRLKPIIQFSTNKHPELKGVAHVYDYAKTEEERGVFDMIFGRYVLGRPIMAPPETPPERLKALRTAFMATMNDPEFLADAEKVKIEIGPSNGEDVEQLVKRFFSYPPNVITKAIAAME